MENRKIYSKDAFHNFRKIMTSLVYCFVYVDNRVLESELHCIIHLYFAFILYYIHIFKLHTFIALDLFV